ncbi:uncharacterized protein LOC108672944 [Hyalella azteca]|uniref:Uncharacterized protein LOC108672944 n=1 Tax=Hyalella azteca TaxID=294128 RepID=A0A979FH87_HYAAZ|nr:uncharacterized protein LOC108672944 [Hyalella azteca]
MRDEITSEKSAKASTKVVNPQKSRKEILQEVDQERKERLQLKKDVFGEDWLDKCYEQVTYPNPACIELMEKVGRVLAKRITTPQDSEQKQQALFYLLGPEYTEQYFPTRTYSVDILEPPKMLPARKEKYLEEMTEFLKNTLDKAMDDCGFPRLYTEHSVDDELYRYLLAARTVFRKGLEQRVMKERGKKINGTSAEKLQVLVAEGGPQMRVTGSSIVALLNKQPSKKKAFIQSVSGKKMALPGALRRFVWTEVMAGKDKSLKLKEGQSWEAEKLKLFTADLSKQAKKQGLARVTRSKNGGLIDAAVIEMFDESQVFKSLDSDDFSMRIARVLNTADVHSGNFSPFHAYHVIALYTAYHRSDLQPEDDDSETLHLAFLMTQVASLLLPKPDSVFAMAERALGTVQVQDSFYYSHIKESLANQPSKITGKEFPPEVLDRNPSAGTKLLDQIQQQLSASGELQAKQLLVFTDPAIFVRKWIAQCFMGVLSVGASMWVWDQLMLGGWSPEVFIDVATAVLCLLRPWMLRANKYSGAKKVLLQEPGKIYTSDLRKVYNHLQSKGRLVEAPPNTNYIGPPSPPAIQLVDENGQHSPAQSDETRIRRLQSTQSMPRDSNKTSQQTSARGEDPKTSVRKASSTPLRDDNDDDSSDRPKMTVKPFQVGTGFSLEVDKLLDAKDDDDDDDEPLPLPEPPPDSDDEQKPEDDTPEEDNFDPPAPFVPPPAEDKAWLPHDPSTRSKLPKPCRISDTVDLYIDSVRFMPDCANLCKITGRVFNIHLDDDVKSPEILAYPSLLGSLTCPTFKYRLVLNEDRQFLNPDLVVMLTLHIQQESIRLVTPLGSCLVSLFNSDLAEPLLCVGAYQKRLRYGRPKPEGGMTKLVASDMDNNKPIPALTILYRIMPHTKEYIPAPAYETGAYRSKGCQPTTTELALIHHYCYHPEYETSTMQDRAEALMTAEKESGVGDLKKVEAYFKKKLQNKIPKGKTLPPETDFAHFTEYNIAQGFKVDVQGAFNLPEAFEGYYILAYAEVIDSEEGEAEREKEEEKKKKVTDKKKAAQKDFVWIDEYPPGEQRMMTSRLDTKSSPRAPQWLDEHVASLYPPLSSMSVLIVRLFGVQLEYSPGNGSKPGTISGLGGSPIALNYKNPLCWGAVQLFGRGTVLCGSHFVPLFQGGPPPMVLAMFRRERTVAVLETAIKKKYCKLLPGASLEVRLWDGKIEDFTELPECWHKHLLTALKMEDKALEGREARFTPTYEKFYTKGLKEVERHDLTRVLAESEFFRQAANIEFGKALNKALVTAGKEPMPPLPVFVP